MRDLFLKGYVLAIIIGTLAFGFTLGLFEDKVFSAECTPVYGGGEVCAKVAIGFIDKVIYNPKTKTYVDNLTEADFKFAPNAIITFRITIKNTGALAINSVKVIDTFPSYVKFLSGIGKSENGVLTIQVGDLAPGASQEFIIRGQVVAKKQLPKDKTLVCPVNKVKMEGKADSDIIVSDSSQLCIEKPSKPAKELPDAGAGALILVTSTLAGTGLFLRKYSKN